MNRRTRRTHTPVTPRRSRDDDPPRLARLEQGGPRVEVRPPRAPVLVGAAQVSDQIPGPAACRAGRNASAASCVSKPCECRSNTGAHEVTKQSITGAGAQHARSVPRGVSAFGAGCTTREHGGTRRAHHPKKRKLNTSSADHSGLSAMACEVPRERTIPHHHSAKLVRTFPKRHQVRRNDKSDKPRATECAQDPWRTRTQVPDTQHTASSHSTNHQPTRSPTPPHADTARTATSAGVPLRRARARAAQTPRHARPSTCAGGAPRDSSATRRRGPAARSGGPCPARRSAAGTHCTRRGV